MKYLKYFENSESDIRYNIQEITDVFQDIIDDYDMEKSPLNSANNGLNYHLVYQPELKQSTFFGKGKYILFMWDQRGGILSTEILQKIDFTPYIKRLKDMGYEVDKNIWSPTSRNIKIEMTR